MRQRRRGWVLGMSVFSVIMSLLCTGCGRKPGKEPEDTYKVTPVEISEVERISLSKWGMERPEISNFTMTRTEEGTEVALTLYTDEEYVHMEDPALLDKVREILEENQVGNWNGFHGSNSHVLDGDGFGLFVEFTDGTTISASGENRYPKNYSETASALWKLIEPTRQCWREEAYPKTITDTHIDTFSFCVMRSNTTLFNCCFGKRLDDPGAHYLTVMIGKDLGYPDYEDYSFYGKVPDPPFEKLQEAVEKYHLAEWNGYEEYAGQGERYFSLDISYESGESIEGRGTLLPENYEAAEEELIQIILDYIEERGDDFEPLN